MLGTVSTRYVLTDCWVGEGNTPLQILSLVSVISLCVTYFKTSFLNPSFKVLKFAKKRLPSIAVLSLTTKMLYPLELTCVNRDMEVRLRRTEEVENVLRMLALSVSFGFIFIHTIFFSIGVCVCERL